MRITTREEESAVKADYEHIDWLYDRYISDETELKDYEKYSLVMMQDIIDFICLICLFEKDMKCWLYHDLILDYSKRLLEPVIKGNMSKRNTLKRHIRGCFDERTYEPGDVNIFLHAYESKKKYCNLPMNTVFKNDIYPNLNRIFEDNRHRIGKFMKTFYLAFCRNDIDAIEFALNRYIYNY